MTSTTRHNPFFRHCRIPVLFVSTLFLFVAFSHQTVAQDTPDLLIPVNEQSITLDARQSRLLEAVKERPYVAEVHLVRIVNGIGLLQRSSIEISVDRGTPLTFTLSQIKQRGTEEFTWIGRSPKQWERVLFVVDGLDVTGIIHTDNASYTVDPLGAGLHALARIDPSAMLREENDVLNNKNNGIRYEQEAAKTGGSARMTTQTTSVIHTLVVYTAAAASASGNISSVISGAIDATNDVLSNSGVAATLSLVHQAQISYSETGSHCTAADRLQDPSDGYMDNAHSLREQYAADIVVVIGHENDPFSYGCVAGIEVNASYAFASVEWDQAIGYYTFAHEVGHMIGGRHHNDSNSSPRAYAHGYVYASANWRTVMATVSGSTIRIPYWSDPGQTYGGVAMGTSSWNDNVRVWEERAATVAKFGLPAPSNLDVSGSTGQNPYLTWTASTSATGYNIYRCANVSYICSNFSYIGTTTNTYYTDTEKTIGTQCGVGPDEITWYYVTAYNGSRESDPSDDDSTCTDSSKQNASSTEPVPTVFALRGNYPNPFNPTTTISMDLPEAAQVSVEIIDMLGRVVLEVPAQEMAAGVNRSIELDASRLSTGAYLYRVVARTAEHRQVGTGRLTLVK